MTFRGLSAFPLTPCEAGKIDVASYEKIVARAVNAGVDSLGALGSTGSYAYLSRTDRAAVARSAVAAAGAVPVIVGVGAISTSAVLENVEDAADAGAAGVLLAPVSYQPLTDDEVYRLYDDVVRRFPDTPVVIYENPATTGVTFTHHLRTRIAHLPGIASIKLGSLPEGENAAADFVAALRAAIPPRVTVGISGDALAARGLIAGCDTWYSVLGGTFPALCRRLTTAAQAGNGADAVAVSEALTPVWNLFTRYGSYRTVAAIATLIGLSREDAVYAPVQALGGTSRDEVATAVATARATLGPLS